MMLVTLIYVQEILWPLALTCFYMNKIIGLVILHASVSVA